jgi:4-alpha-glucanotransferase
MTDPARWGVDTGYHAGGTWRDAPPSTLNAVVAAMRRDEDREAPAPDAGVLVVRPGDRLPAGQWRLTLEDGAEVDIDGTIPTELPIGYHRMAGRFAGASDVPVPLIVAPERCAPGPESPAWGWSVQVYAARSAGSWGMGDLADLRRLAEWSAGLGAGALLLNPLHAGSDPSPYSASSRSFRDPDYLCVEKVEGVEGVGPVAAAARALNGSRVIDRDQVRRLKSAALEAAFSRFDGDPAFDRYRAAQGAPLEGFTTFCALAERHGEEWLRWPPELRRPDGDAVHRFRADPEGGERVRFHAWLQWWLDRQYADAAGAGVGLINDLAVGTRVHGADSWLWQDCLALDMRIGAPPDEFNNQGQNWHLPPFDPWRLRAAGYQPFVQALRAGLARGGGLRLDHVMGLFRLFWIPEGASPDEGTYVRYPWRDLLAIVALESRRAGGFVVGEDLGTVEDLVREELARREMLSYKVLWFEPEPPATWPRQALGAVSTHDLPTVAGLWTGRDLAAQREVGSRPDEAAAAVLRTRLRHRCHLADGAPVEEAVLAAYRLLAEAPCAVLTATLEDACGVWERPNIPGTVDEWPNWRLALPTPIEELERAPLVRSLAGVLASRHGVAAP